jgi:hypothetical protein
MKTPNDVGGCFVSKKKKEQGKVKVSSIAKLDSGRTQELNAGRDTWGKIESYI